MLALVITGLALNMLSVDHALAIVVSFQLLMFAISRPRPGFVFMAAMTQAQLTEFEAIMESFKGYGGVLKELDFAKTAGLDIKGLGQRFEKIQKDLNNLKKSGIASSSDTGVYWRGNQPFVSDDCARAITAVFVLDCARLKNGLETLVPNANKRDEMIALSAGALGIETKAALSTTEIPIPTIYAPQIIELVFAYGQARKYCTVFPLGSGTVKLPRLKAGEDDFQYYGVGSAGMSQAIVEKKVTAELVTFTANKAGGLIRIPYELEDDTMIPIGQFLARYIARQLAKLEDKTLFLADGTATYANQTGVGPYCVANPTYLLQLAASKTKPSDASLNDFRNLRAKVSAAVLGNMIANGQTEAAYYLSPTFEPLLRGFNSYPNFVVFEYVNGKPTLDGWPVRWIGSSQVYQTTAAASTFIAFFGALSYWFLGERGTPRVEVSREVFFATDELAMRALERIDVEVLGIDAMATLQTAAS